MKYLLFILLSCQMLFSSEQIVFVLAEDYKSTKAKLVRYEKITDTFKRVSAPISVNLGKKGLAWEASFSDRKNLPIKKEGDKKAVVGVYKLTEVFGYKTSLNSNMPYTQSTKDLICVDDINSKYYNQVIRTKNKEVFSSYENMLLKNETYEFVIQVAYNTKNTPKNGSCIFLHVENKKQPKTSGCTSMEKKEIKKLISWLDIKKNPLLIQIPYSACEKMKHKYKFLECDL